jgi:proteasome lid subunit RPN8/RPN11
MVAQALAERPNECCGLLGGVRQGGQDGPVGQVVQLYPLVNAAASPVEYLSDPRSMFAAIKDMRQRQLEPLAVYHSHPTSEPVPSRKDLALNYSPEVVNLIVSLATVPPTVRGWWLTDVDYREAEWSVEG